MPPGSVWVGRACFLMKLTFETRTRSFFASTSTTSPCFPLSLPERTTTLSFFFTCSMSHHLRGQGDDLQVVPLAQLPGDGPEDARALGLAVVVDEDAGVVVEADVGAVRAAVLFPGPHDDALDHVALLDRRVGEG